MQIPAGLLLDKFGSKKCLTLATLGCGLGNIIFVSGDYLIALIGRLMIGLGSSFAFIGVLKLSKEYLSTRYFGLFASIVISIGTLAAAFSQQMSVWLSQYHVSWIYIFIMSGLLALPFFLYFWLSTPTPKDTTHLLPQGADIFQVTLVVAKQKQLWLNASWAGVFYIPTVVLTSQYGVYFFTQTYNLSRYHATEMVTFLLLGWVVFSPIVVILFNLCNMPRTFITSFMAAVIAMMIIFCFYADFFTPHLCWYVFIFGIFSSLQVLVWEFFNTVGWQNYTAVGLAFTNMIITGITEAGQLFSGVVLDLANHFNHIVSIIMNNTQVMMLTFIFMMMISWYIFNRSVRTIP